MNILMKTFKWEARSWVNHFKWLLLLAAVCIAIVLVLPAPNTDWHIVPLTLVLSATGLTLVPILLAFYMIAGYPLLSLAISEVLKTAALPHQTGHSTFYLTIVRVAFNALTTALGCVIIAITMAVLRPMAYFDWLQAFFYEMPRFTAFFDLLIFFVLLLISLGLPAILLNFFSVIRLQVKTWVFVVMIFSNFFPLLLSPFFRSTISDLIIWGFTASFMLFMCCYTRDNHAQLEVPELL